MLNQRLLKELREAVSSAFVVNYAAYALATSKGIAVEQPWSLLMELPAA